MYSTCWILYVYHIDLKLHYVGAIEIEIENLNSFVQFLTHKYRILNARHQ